MHTILITGAGGYIGSVLCPIMLERGYHVTAVDVNLKALVPCSYSSAFKPVVCDVLNEDIMPSLIKNCGGVIHLAAVVGAKAVDNHYPSARKLMIEGTQRLLRWADGKPFIYPNTDAGYPSGSYAHENTPMGGHTHYSELKIEGEKMVLAAGGVSLRLGSVFGSAPVMRHATLLNWLVQRAVLDGKLVLSQPGARRTLLHVKDAAGAIAHAVANFDAMRGKAFNVALPAVRKLALCELIKMQLPQFSWVVDDAAYADPDERDFNVDCTRLLLAGFKPQINVGYGIAELSRAYTVLGG